MPDKESAPGIPPPTWVSSREVPSRAPGFGVLEGARRARRWRSWSPAGL